ncbi:preprotein translocase subunit YajC [Idiomarina loihiensis]|jgi:preprotein translocase subunit YajC|uniref:Sec translocon accessory complex subunit YajC n=1 Tax=Idiomarina loihiensis (strain ATCC BAA-735 / DSM 15497 / L2-TR) TaxID=283942 RepID=Q5QVG3_IDILO|nr:MULTISPECIES: preprotein translocase subunit YajC [Idiomarina]AAV82981.1 Preprotein translocase subunit YajC [Idiomarina loihiensis L2TR]AGM37026.1 preprotein translocase subunit YajC [Idiomarina loihiensis GSL 199]MAA61322.1 preprotein translocase subunit YajC [Idiomarina sp.]MBL4855435.1 preprotein translocase subunit YajC [Idiomarina sp.]MRJ44917.1 preprotein translocase subunit YajC [Idiomarina loihiensis]|tara:strand:+ start:62 stop:397 length:336 start_codon:yes stop_codon:yes gene_type:complete
MDFFISSAYAQDAGGQGSGGMELIFMLVMFALIFYFMIYRPQAKRVKQHKELMGALSKGDEVLTQGGLVGKITKVSEDKDFLVIALTDELEVTIQKGSVTSVLPKGTMKSL